MRTPAGPSATKPHHRPLKLAVLGKKGIEPRLSFAILC